MVSATPSLALKGTVNVIMLPIKKIGMKTFQIACFVISSFPVNHATDYKHCCILLIIKSAFAIIYDHNYNCLHVIQYLDQWITMSIIILPVH